MNAKLDEWVNLYVNVNVNKEMNTKWINECVNIWVNRRRIGDLYEGWIIKWSNEWKMNENWRNA